MVKLIRYADQGFKGYTYFEDDRYCPKFVDWENNKLVRWVDGCFVFVEEVDEDALTNWASKRFYQPRHEIMVPDDTLVWVNNTKWSVNENNKLTYNNVYRDIQDGYLAWNAWVQVPAIEVANTVREIKEKTGEVCYEWCEAIYFSGEYADDEDNIGY